ncbi:NADH-quinone oxidoreductase subunit N [Desertivirga xinjiangensis]|uniref:NADH-quinone oxidoreductase subunit N n=1 Tax=Desertivirga xinjiangensis TaxID=539206 RepID=UPI00210D76EA|nr:NADH-quinone oxidoreductase subunit N [Pedobacter xinjiangensis]
MNEYLPFLSGLLKDTLSGIPYILPEIVLVLTFLVVIVADLFLQGKRSSAAFWLSITGIIISVFFSFKQIEAGADVRLLFFENIQLDQVAVSFKFIFAFVVLLFALFIRYDRNLQSHAKGVGDLYMLLPAVLLGLNLMAMSTSLLMIYISIEMVSIGSYLMVGYVSAGNRQTEASMKYALFGSACSAIMLYGISLLYGFTGTINISDPDFIVHLGEIPEPATALAIILTMVGIGFKLSFVPLHFWSPDVYEGAPTPVTAFLSTAPKIAGFAILVRFLFPFYDQQSQTKEVFDFETTFAVVAIITMIVGNFAALWQNNIKRMLAYSSIGHTGFALMAVVSNSDYGVQSLVFYFSIYAIMNMAAFMLAGRIERQTAATEVDDYKGLGSVLKAEMVCFVVILISLTGLPPTAGFLAKLYVFSAAFEKYTSSGSIWMVALLITGALTTVVSLFYYLKIPLNAYLRKSANPYNIENAKDPLIFIIAILTFCVILFGIFPSLISW